MNQLRKRNFLLIYAIFFLLLFLQFPLNDSLPGNCDSLFVIAWGNDYLNRIISSFVETSAGVFLYPEAHFYRFGESSFGTVGIFMLFKLFGLNDIWAYYFYISSLFIFTAFGIFLLGSLYVKNRSSAFFGGLFFTCSTFVLANIDDFSVVCYAGPAFSAFFLKKYFIGKNNRHFIYTAIIGGLQAYVNLYVFCYQTIILLVMFLLNIKKEHWRLSLKSIISGFVIYIALPMPFVLLYYFTLTSGSFHDIWMDLQLIDGAILRPDNLLGSLQNNIIYPVRDAYYEGITSWTESRKRAFIGLLVPLLALIGIFRRNKHCTTWIIAATLGLLLCLGIDLGIGWEKRVVSVTHLMINFFPDVQFVRMPLRAFLIFLFSLSIIAAVGFDVCIVGLQKLKRKSIVSLVLFPTIIFGIMILENVPFPMAKYPLKKYVQIPTGYAKFFKNKKNSIVLDLPTSLWSGNTSDLVFDYSREVIYMIWQTYHKQNSVVGVNGYYPQQRVDLQEKVLKLPAESSFKYLKNLNVEYVAFHKQMIMPEMDEYYKMAPGWRPAYFYTINESELLTKLKSSQFLKLVWEDNETSIFELVMQQ